MTKTILETINKLTMKSESLKNISLAIISVMNEVKGVDKTMTVGTGSGSYKGVPDQEVKKIIGASMAKNGLSILPIGIKPFTKIERWEETGGAYGPKQKQSVFTEATTKYLLLHTSGEWIELSGYGHGVDSQDKGAGKATTYALKYTLLYTFLVPTGKIDDSDNVHSEDVVIPAKKQVQNVPQDYLFGWQVEVDKCQTENDLSALWDGNKATCVNDQDIIAMFKKRKAEINKPKK